MHTAFLRRTAPLAATLAVAASFAAYTARPAEAAKDINNLRGTWKGRMVRQSDEAEVLVKLTLSTDKKQGSGARLIKGDVTVGKKKYSKLIGSFEPITNILQISQLPNPRNPMAPLAVVQGKVAADGKSFEACAVTLANPGGANTVYEGVGVPAR